MFKFFRKYRERRLANHPQAKLIEHFGNYPEIAFRLIGMRLSYYQVNSKFIGYATAGAEMLHRMYSIRDSECDFYGISSAVLVNDCDEYYLPIIDFIGRPTKYDLEVFYNKLINTVPSLEGNVLNIYDSTNSYHGYIFKLLTQNEWLDFGEFLKTAPFVDKRWLYLSDSLALRWTSFKAKSEPKFAFSIKHDNYF